MTYRRRTLRTTVAVAVSGALVGAGLAGAVPAASLTRTVANTAAIQIGDGTTTPYPSTIAVAGLPIGVTDVNVRLTGLTHDYPDDLDVLLVGPRGQSVILLRAAGGATPVDGINLMVDDGATGPAPDETELDGRYPYRPTDYAPGDSLPAPAPATTAATLSGFNGTDPNGIWSLYVIDQVPGGTGVVSGGWSMMIATVNRPARPVLSTPVDASTDVDGALQFTGTATAGSTVTVRDNGRAVTSTIASATGTFSGDVVGIPDGEHSYTAVATDSYGNSSPSTPSHTVSVDRVAPGGTIDIVNPSPINGTLIGLHVTATDPVPGSGIARMRFSNNGVTWSAFRIFAPTTTWTLSKANGTKKVWAQFSDRAGHVSAAVSDTIRLDSIGPRVTRARPAEDASGVPVDANVRAFLSEAVRPVTINGDTVRLVRVGRTRAVRASVSYAAARHRITIDPRHHLAHGARYKVTVTIGVIDLANNSLDQLAKSGLQPKTWYFTTG